MRSSLCEKIRGGFVWAVFFAVVSIVLVACSDDKSVAGGSTEDAGIIAIKNLDVAGLTQKGPFVKGSAVTVQGIDCKTLQLTDEHFEGSVKSDKGDFTVKEVSLKSTCALFEVTGLYRSEITGKKSSKELNSPCADRPQGPREREHQHPYEPRIRATLAPRDREGQDIRGGEIAGRTGSACGIRHRRQFRGVRKPEHL